MAAPSRGKKKVDLRELMRQQKAAKQVNKQRIESPLAKYNNIGQLICVVCNQQVKSEILWTAHIQGKKHKDNVVLLKTGKPPAGSVVSRPEKTEAPPRPLPSGAPIKRKAEPAPLAQPVKGILKKPRFGLPYGDSSSDESDTEQEKDPLPPDFFDSGKGVPAAKKQDRGSSDLKKTSNDAAPKGLPADFFDNTRTSLSQALSSKSRGDGDEAPSSSAAAAESKKDQDPTDKPMSEVLPEGFFDDPVKDAKARHVEVRNTMEEEWDKFQKEMETQKQVSETIAEEDDTAAQTERSIDEIDEQIQCFAKVETLWNKQDEIKTKAEDKRKEHGTATGDNEEDDSGDDEAEFEEFLNWRSKGAWK